MSGKLLAVGGRLQRAAGFLLSGQAPENTAVPCPCCGKVYYVQLRTCCLQTGGDDIGSPYPNGLGPFYIPLNLLQANCGAGDFGYLAFFPGEDGVAEFCMTYNLQRDPPIPSSALPEGATIVSEEDTFVCYENSICQNEEICPPCPACCHEVSLGWRCVRGIDPNPNNPNPFICNFGRTYRVTFDWTSTYEQRIWQSCISAETIRCDLFSTTNTTTEREGVMTFTKACPPDNVASCTGEATTTTNNRTETFGSYVGLCTDPPTGGSVIESTDTTVTDCEDWNFTLVGPSGPDDPDEFCADTKLEEERCQLPNTGDLFKRVTTEWDYDRACFEGTTSFRRTDQRWYKDQATCPRVLFTCPQSPIAPCIDQECSFEEVTDISSYTVEIIGIIGCEGPWETYDTNIATGYPGDAAGFFEGWYSLGLGNAEGFL